MANFDEMDDLFSGNLDSKMDFLNEKKQVNADGIYRIDLSKVKDKKRGYRSVVRFLPNLTKEGKVGQAAIEKISHYVDIKNAKELSGWFDSAKNFPGEKCALTDLFYNMTNSKNAILQEKAKCLKYSRKYYSYVLILEEEKGVFKNIPAVDGKVDSKVQSMVREFLMKRDHELEEFSPKRLNEEQQAKVSEIINFLTGKASSSYNSAKESKPSSDDFEMDTVVSGSGSMSNNSEDEDDFFKDF